MSWGSLKIVPLLSFALTEPSARTPDIWAVRHDGRGGWRPPVRVLGPTEKLLGNNEP
ncbi:rCG25948 [Rattus norvegicus]|uniref:RCG25948 n=1 Tax=Rattus norvegicus TaxID=10116 RepID=A6I480_RAT|nr:rCG25948 [Rattus norvegicus]